MEKIEQNSYIKIQWHNVRHFLKISLISNQKIYKKNLIPALITLQKDHHGYNQVTRTQKIENVTLSGCFAITVVH